MNSVTKTNDVSKYNKDQTLVRWTRAARATVDPPSLSLGMRRDPGAIRHVAELDGDDIAGALRRALERGGVAREYEWLTPGRYAGRRKNETWRSTWCLVIDVDHVAAHAERSRNERRALARRRVAAGKPIGDDETIAAEPDEIAKASWTEARALWRAIASDGPFTLAHVTASGGARLFVVLDMPLQDERTYARAAHAACARAHHWLASGGLDTVYAIDGASEKRAQMYWSPPRSAVIHGSGEVYSLGRLVHEYVTSSRATARDTTPSSGEIDDPARYFARAIASEADKIRSARERNKQLNASVYALAQWHELSDEQITSALGAAAMEAGLGERETRDTIASALRAGRAAPPKQARARQAAPPDPDDELAHDDELDARGEEQPEPTRLRIASGPRALELGDHVELGRELLREVRGDGPDPVHDEGELYRYESANGLWVRVSRELQSRIVQSYSGVTIGKKKLKLKRTDITGAIALAADQAHREQFFAQGPRGLAFHDGFVQVSASGEIAVKPHSPENRARYGYSFPYVQGAPRRWLAFLDEIFRDDEDKQERIAFVHEFFGACLLGVATRFNRALMLLSASRDGLGGEGKGTLLKIIEAAMPKGSTSAIPPQDFAHEYQRAQLVNKLLNVVSELPEASILQSESFKAIVSGDLINCRPIRESPFSYAPIAGHAFSANRAPGSDDATQAFWDRWIVLPFARRMRGTSADVPGLADRIIADELPAIVASLVQAGARAVRENGYTIPPSHTAAIEEWRGSADVVRSFVVERTTPSLAPRWCEPPHDWTTTAVLYRAFRAWCDETGHKPMALKKFGARLTSAGAAGGEHTRAGTFFAVRLT